MEDEDSMDGLETTETENTVETEIKEHSVEEDAETEVNSSKQPVSALQRSVSEESANSLVSVGVEAKIRLDNEENWTRVTEGEGW